MNSPYRQAENIMISAQVLIGNTITVDAVAYPVYHSWAFADVELQRDVSGTPPNAYCVLDWPVLLAGHGGYHQLDVYVLSRIGTPGELDADPYGKRARKMLEHVHYALGTSRDRYCFEVLDYADDPLNPETTGYTAIIKGRGIVGSPELVESFDLERGYVGYRSVYNIMLEQDTIGGKFYENNP